MSDVCLLAFSQTKLLIQSTKPWYIMALLTTVTKVTLMPRECSMLQAGKFQKFLRIFANSSAFFRLYNNSQSNTCKFVTIIPTNIFGPHDNYNLEDSHVIPGLIHKCHIAKGNNPAGVTVNELTNRFFVEKGTDFVIWGSGKPLRQFIYSVDLVKIIFVIL